MLVVLVDGETATVWWHPGRVCYCFDKLQRPITFEEWNLSLADLTGGRQGHAPPGPNSFIFMQFLGNVRPNIRLVPPPLGNPGSATAYNFGLFS